mmetsp:Transcript_19340/g.22335  ORF Transcript_19340/g.22335 Transcript_19340/m.22335 type:complete len:399 (+) Transcript_19340:47-1243(+)
MKLSILFIIGIIALTTSNTVLLVNGDTNESATTTTTATSKEACLTSISETQQCIKTCGERDPFIDSSITPGSTTYEAIRSSGSLLLQCTSQGSEKTTTPNGTKFSLALDDCCDMTPECQDSYVASSTCLKTDMLATIQIQAAQYLNCLDEKSRSGECGYADWCIRLLTGGAGVGEENDFDLASPKLYNMTRDATTCTDMEPFLVDACNTVSGCCPTCQPFIANVVEAVINDLLLPVYNQPSLQCPDMTCPTQSPTTAPVEAATTATATPSQRNLEGTTVHDSNDDDSITGYGSDLVVDYSNECNDEMASNIVVYNETFAVDSFFSCLTQKMGKIIARAEYEDSVSIMATNNGQGGGQQEADDAKDDKESSNSSLSLSSSSFLFFVMATASLLSTLLLL